jgi:hypothetical protein
MRANKGKDKQRKKEKERIKGSSKTDRQTD